MRRIPSAAERARWLAEVAQALDQAVAVLDRMSGSAIDNRERIELARRIEAARKMTRSLRLSSERRTAQPFRPQ